MTAPSCWGGGRPDSRAKDGTSTTTTSGTPTVSQIEVVLNWFTELQQRVPFK